jgi:hypothetical protein
MRLICLSFSHRSMLATGYIVHLPLEIIPYGRLQLPHRTSIIDGAILPSRAYPQDFSLLFSILMFVSYIFLNSYHTNNLYQSNHIITPPR